MREVGVSSFKFQVWSFIVSEFHCSTLWVEDLSMNVREVRIRRAFRGALRIRITTAASAAEKC